MTGGLGKYLGDRLTDQRHKREAERQKKEAFDRVKEQMPQLIRQMQNDIVANQLVRDFFIVGKKWSFNTDSSCLKYYYEDHDNLDAKVNILESYGYVRDVTPGNAKKFRMNEDFVRLLLSTRI